ncbi:multicomponent Na+:H+ antiporter subunit D [Kineosphaera limosa]|uniref:Na(+)/H(+) antiporter subunit D n=1 Tax=Kineosphaera limosa NBRC 100340 TaxID=1184609 RepID=K6X7Q4_9MICO|nr:Na+/H+ antiporter subunit D [Kineosphaera limosa]NYD98866.1 multicomponent Na+:H+ antiporter subunit D [Kineosphaera limosa]GAB94809.1 Na(+)/H(+) antiporter subunit D [Kineosphaera limosa NBRC 100340]
MTPVLDTLPAAPTWLVPLPVLLPLVGAGLTLVLGGRDQWQRFISITVFVGVLMAACGLVYGADRFGPLVVEAGGWPVPMGIVLIADRLAALMVLVSVIVTFSVLLFSIGQGRSSEDERDAGSPLPIFHPTLMVLLAGVCTTFLSGDLFHIFVGFEMLLTASFVLLTLGGTAERVRAGVNYVFVSMLSSLIFLTAIALTYAATGTVNLAQLAGRLDALPDSTRVTLQVLLLLGFCIKAAVFPMSGWLPDSYPTAPAPVTAVFAGLLTKVGVYAIIRTQTLLFPQDTLNTVLLWAALLTMIVGILGAIAQDDIKRLLSFTLVSHIGYMLFGVAIGNEIGLSGAIFYVVHHIMVQTALFLVSGLIEWRGGSTSLSELGGLARTSPLIAVLFFIPAMNLAGIPPFSGFLGKVALLQGGVQSGTWLAYLLIAGSVLTSLLTLYAVSRVWSQAFWRRAPEPGGGQERPAIDSPTGALRLGVVRAIPRGMTLPTTGLVILGVAITVAAGPLYEITDRAATDLRARSPYITSVFDQGVVP